ncbi:multicopper oxidase domain-containing protein [Geotalea toluenoxydans]|uniref:multicopper oxidase domain-containing protein n=1 Tax=Geotalea toluenoxydans TaxID=421624 RepID=UPI000A5AA336|nr:multicopper oxidase domain-containing protein [Geotalea toluenoxydans]
MINTGPDFPFNGSLETPADPGTTGQVMQFIVNTSLTQTSDSKTTTPQNLVLPAERPLGAATYTRRLSLNEEESNQLCVQTLPDGSIVTLFNRPKDADFAKDCAAAGGSPMAPKRALFGVMAKDSSGDLVSMPLRWMDPVTETPLLNSTEVWELFNTTADAHPIHLHMVRFNVLNRQEFDPDDFTPIDEAAPATPTEAGYKDTVLALPGQITRIKAKFDIPGLFVWHCHILEHEDNEMMRPYVVRLDSNFPDFNQDSKVDTADYSLLLAEIRKATLKNIAYDLNQDGKVDMSDAKFFNTALNKLKRL